MDAPLELWTNLWSPFGGPKEADAEAGFLSQAQRESVDAVFREAIETTEGKLASALGREAHEMSMALYVYFEPLVYLVVALDPFEKKVSVCANYTYWPALKSQGLISFQPCSSAAL